MKTSTSLILGLVLAMLIVQSCEEKPVDIPEFELGDSKRVVLLEDLTGVSCPNCPKAAREVDRLSELLGDKIVSVGIHGDFLADPIAGKSKYDFRNEKAAELETFHAPFIGKPSGVINRVKFEGESFIPVDFVENWQGYIEKELAKEQTVAIALEHNYDETSRLLNLEVRVTPLKDEQGEFNISVFVLENGIVDYQKDLTTTIADFEHNHVLRDMLTKAAGDPLSTDFVAQSSISKSYSYTIPTDFKAEKMEFVVSVHRNNPEDKTVIQSGKVKLK